MTGTAGRVVIVTGTGTGVGKTIVTAALAATASGTRTVIKPVQTGADLGDNGDIGDIGDIATIHALTGCAGQEYTALEDPLAPDTAARRRGLRIPPVAEYADRIGVLAEFDRTVLVEGAGGVLVRLDTDGGTLIDIATALLDRGVQVEVVVVVDAGLGTLNLTELTVGALRSRGIEPAGLVIGSWPRDPGLVELCNLDDLPRLSGVPLLGRIPQGAGALARDDFVRAAPTWLGGWSAQQAPPRLR